jgi:hypothetical protein
MKYPNAELVGQAWMAAYSSIPAAAMAGTLPAVGKWTPAGDGVGFLQMRALSRRDGEHRPPRTPSTVLQVDGYGTRIVKDTFRPVWSVAMDLAGRGAGSDPLPGVRPPADHAAGRLPGRPRLRRYLISEPVRVEKDPSGYARVTANLEIDWTV